MFEVVTTPKNPQPRAIIRCTGLNERAQRCKKRLLDVRLPSKPMPSHIDAGVLEVQCSRCGTMNHIRVNGLTL